jgi:hypothetical protein
MAAPMPRLAPVTSAISPVRGRLSEGMELMVGLVVRGERRRIAPLAS